MTRHKKFFSSLCRDITAAVSFLYAADNNRCQEEERNMQRMKVTSHLSQLMIEFQADKNLFWGTPETNAVTRILTSLRAKAIRNSILYQPLVTKIRKGNVGSSLTSG